MYLTLQALQYTMLVLFKSCLVQALVGRHIVIECAISGWIFCFFQRNLECSIHNERHVDLWHVVAEFGV